MGRLKKEKFFTKSINIPIELKENLDDYRDSKVILAQIKDTELLAIVEKESNL